MQVTLKLHKETDNGRALYREDGGRSSVRFTNHFLPEMTPEEVIITVPDGSWRAPGAGVPGPEETPEVTQAREVLAKFRAEKKAARDASRAARGLPPKGKKKGKK